MHSTPRSGAVDEVPVRDVTLMQISPARREPPPTPLPRLPTFPARSAMPGVLRMISTAAALTLACIGRLPAARADLDSICATGIDEIFAEVAEQSSAELIAPGGCDAAAAAPARLRRPPPPPLPSSAGLPPSAPAAGEVAAVSEALSLAYGTMGASEQNCPQENTSAAQVSHGFR